MNPAFHPDAFLAIGDKESAALALIHAAYMLRQEDLLFPLTLHPCIGTANACLLAQVISPEVEEPGVAMISAASVFERRMATAPIRLDQTDDSRAYAAWGRALAALHNRPTAGAMAAPLPWVLSRVPRATGRAEAALIELLPVEQDNGSVRTGVADVVAWVSLSDPLSWALESAAAQWSATGWIHGEAARTHALFSPPGRRRSARVQLICVGLSGLGDPDWDLATAYDSILGSGLLPLPYATAVLHAYALAEGPGRLRRDALAARMILTSLRIAAAASCSTPSPGTNTWGSRAMEHLLHAERIAQDGLLGAGTDHCGS